jgi:hypothetical protein
MAASKHQALLGKHVLIAFSTTHFDRAGETGTHVIKYGEIVALESPNWVVVSAESGEHLRCPIAKLHRAAKSAVFPPSADGETLQPNYFAAEELIRDFHSVKRPLVLKWLGSKSALRACIAKANG